MKKKALVLTNHLHSFAGSEILALEVAETLVRLGFDVLIYCNALAPDIAKHTFPEISLSDSDTRPNFFEYDFVWMHHLVAPLCLPENLPDFEKNQVIVSAHLSPYEEFEHIGLGLAKDIGAQICSNSTETARAISHYVENQDVFNFFNACSPSFWSASPVAAQSLKKVLLVSNHLPQELIELQKLTSLCDVEFTHIGNVGKYTRLRPHHIEEHDAVITIGKTVQNSLLMGKPVFVYDKFGGPGWLSEKNFYRAEEYNFSGRCCNQKLEPEEIAKNLKEKFQEAQEFVLNLKDKIKTKYCLETFIKKRIECGSYNKNIETLINSLQKLKPHSVVIRKLYKGSMYQQKSNNRHLILKGEALFKEGNYDKSKKYFVNAIKDDSSNIEALNNLGVVAMQNGEFDEAKNLFNCCLYIDPFFGDASENLRFLLSLETGKNDEEANKVRCLCDEGEAFFQQGNFSEAINCFLKMLELNQENVEALNNLGVIAYQQKNLSRAKEFFRRCTQIDPDFKEASENLEMCKREAEFTDADISHENKKSYFSIITCSVDDTKFSRLQSSLNQSFSEPFELIRIPDAQSLCEGYNRGIREARGDVLVFCHDDIEFFNENLGSRLHQSLESCDIVGVAGTSRLVEGNWIAAGHPYIHGQVAHLTKGKADTYELCIYGNGRDPELVPGIQALDGLFFAVRRDVFKEVSFDEDLFDGFHLYDLDFTYTAFLKGYRIAVDHRINVLHSSAGNYSEDWSRYFKRFNTKHSHVLEKKNSFSLTRFKGLRLETRPAVKREMKRYGEYRRVEIVASENKVSGVELRMTQDGRSVDLPFGDSEIDFFRITGEVKLLPEIIPLMNAVNRVCRHGAMLEIVQNGRVGDVDGEWPIHDCFSLSITEPGYYGFAKEKGFRGQFTIVNNFFGKHKTGERVVEFHYQIIKHVVEKLPSIFENKNKLDINSNALPNSFSNNPKFSIIVPHYQGSVSHKKFIEGINSILCQSFKDFEILCYHDGPLLDASCQFPIKIMPTKQRYNNWGHSLRDLGIKQARGEYIIHFNPDNVLYPNALKILSAVDSDIIIFPVKMMGLERNGELLYYSNPRNYEKFEILRGKPLVFANIDCMQFVMRRSRWLEVGGWFDTRETSDGFMYPLFAEKFGPPAYVSGAPLGEHW
ncbi:glycosyltransferase [Desulfuromonas sp. AOP6]|uniref:glycosyltransferase n=1 Tax=Desulfuromonas sp. AOP6 TaxID=1566351 RepID=UPI00127B362F|nr:glycosyltransferase [Desulfuromonas sp. AOP6]BCA79137.1 hypothetical protein AOP6_0924 [Desulfuromonas sp. AOP6]